MESLEQKYAQTLENSNLSLKQRQVLLSSLKLFSEIGFENTTASLIARGWVSEGPFLVTLRPRRHLRGILSTFLNRFIPDMIADFLRRNLAKPRVFSPYFLRKHCSRWTGFHSEESNAS